MTFRQLEKLSRSGLAAIRPAAFIAMKTGLSESLSRIHSETASSTSENRNGMRQPQPSQSAGARLACAISTTIRLSRKPPITLAWMKLV